MSDIKVVWKYPIVPDQTKYKIKKGAQILSCQIQGTGPQIWALVDPNAPDVDIQVVVVGTGVRMHTDCIDGCTYLATLQTGGGVFVWHVFYRFLDTTQPSHTVVAH